MSEPISHSPTPTQKMPFAEVSDDTLLKRMLQQDHETLAAFYDRYSSLVYTVALHMTGDTVAAETVVMAVFETIWHAAASYSNDQDIAVWVVCITRNHVVAHSEWFKQPSPQAQGNKVRLPQPAPPSDRSPSMLHALAALTAAERMVIELAYYRGLSSTRLASLLGEPVERVKVHLREGLLKLRDHFAHGTNERTA